MLLNLQRRFPVIIKISPDNKVVKCFKLRMFLSIFNEETTFINSFLGYEQRSFHIWERMAYDAEILQTVSVMSHDMNEGPPAVYRQKLLSVLWDMSFSSQRPVNDDVIKWKHFPRNWPIRSVPVNSPHNGQWRGALMFSLICVWINGWVNNRKAGDLRRHRGHYDVNVTSWLTFIKLCRYECRYPRSLSSQMIKRPPGYELQQSTASSWWRHQMETFSA